MLVLKNFFWRAFRLKKLITIITALIMSISIAAPFATQNVKADYIVSDSDYHALNAAKTVGKVVAFTAAVKAGIMAARLYSQYKTARAREAWKNNHTQIHVAVKKAYLYHKNGKRWGGKYYLTNDGHSYIAPKYVYRIRHGRHTMLAYRFGFLHGKPMYLPIHSMAWTHVDDGNLF